MESPSDPEQQPDPLLQGLERILETMSGTHKSAEDIHAAHEGSFAPENVRIRCLTEASKLADDMLQRLFSRRATHEKADTADMDALDLLVTMTERAAKAGDGNSFHAYLDAYLKAYPNVAFTNQGTNIASMCLEGIYHLGSQRAADILHRHLEVEAARADQLEELSKQGRIQGSGYDAATTKCLAQVITYCQINDTPPEQWLNQYAKTEGHVRTLRMRAIREARKAGIGDQQALEDQYTMLSLEDKLARSGDRSSLRMAFDDMHETKEASIREDAYERFTQALETPPPLTQRNILIGDPVLDELIELGDASLGDTGSVNQMLVRKIDEAIDKRVHNILQAGGDLFHTSLPYMRWKLDLEKSSDSNAQTVLGIIDDTTAKVLAMRTGDGSAHAMDEASRNNPRFVLMIKDYFGAKFVNKALEDNDFARAGIFARDLSKRSGILAQAIMQATTKDQIDQLGIGSDPMELMLEPEIQLFIDFAEAKFTHGPQAFTNALLSHAWTIANLSQTFTVNAFKHIVSQDSNTGYTFARNLLAALRANPDGNGNNHSIIAELSEALIRSGDQEEIQLARQDIDKHERPYTRWKELRKLANLLAESSK